MTKIDKKNREFVEQNRNKIFNILVKFFKFFRDNGEKNIGISIEKFVDLFLDNMGK